MVKKISILVLVLLLSGCNKETNNTNIVKSRLITPEINQGLEGYDIVIKEVDNLLKYIYLDGEEPTGYYMNHINKLIDERENQKLYLDDFLNEIKKLSESLDEYIVQESNNVVDENTDNTKDNIEEYEKVEQLEDSDFIQTDEKGRDYIAIKDLEFFTDDIVFQYNNNSYMLDMDNYVPTMKTIKLYQHNYSYIYGREIDRESLELVYLDYKTGAAKTIRVKHNNGNIFEIDFKL